MEPSVTPGGSYGSFSTFGFGLWAMTGGAATDTGFTYDFRKTGVAGDVNYQTFGCNVFQESPPTPDKLTPDISFVRTMTTSGRLTAPDGVRLRYWAFEDPSSGQSAPLQALQ